MKLGIISLAAALVVAAPLAAQTGDLGPFIERLDENHSFDIFPDAPDWKFFRTPSYCYAVIENDDGSLLLGYDQRRNQGHVGFWNKKVASYNTGDTTNLQITLVEIIPGKGIGQINDDWGLNKFFVMRNKAGDRVLNAKLNGQQMLWSFSRYDRLVFYTADNVPVQNFSLNQSAKALRRLAACRPR